MRIDVWMWNVGRSAVVASALVVGGAGACGPAALPPAAPAIARPDVLGTWIDESGDTFEIATGANGEAQLTSAVGNDGEVSTDLKSGWNEAGNFWFQYVVPSTKYLVEIEFTGLDGDQTTYAWKNPHASGTEAMHRER